MNMEDRGFTLLETIIVLAIMTMFFVISIPLFSKFAEKTKLETSARSVTSALRTARVYAITNNTNYYVIFDAATDPDSYFVSEDGTNSKDKREKLPIGISFGAIGFTYGGGPTACFKSTGELNESANDTTLTISDTEGNIKTITVERTTGRVQID